MLAAAAVVVPVCAALALGVADSASPPEAGPKVDTHVEHSNIYVVDVSTRGVTQATNHQGEGALEPAWSQEGQIAFSAMGCDECPSTVSAVDPGDSTQAPVETSVKHVFQPSWAPDGHKLAVVGLGRGIYVIDSADTSARRLTSGRSDEAPNWSPAGDWIAFHKQVRDTNYDLFAVDPATGKQRRLTNDSRQQTNPSWSPGGSKIAFAEQQSNGRWAIVTMNADGSGRRQVTGSSISAQEPSWSPDGKQLAFVLQGVDSAAVAVIGATGDGSPQRLTDGSVFASKPTWSPDGKRVAFAAIRR
jgi:Tol biopolymer transport system component